MKRIITYIAVIVITAFFMFYINSNRNANFSNETRGVFISYIEYMKYFYNKDEQELKVEIDKMIEKVKDKDLNCIYLQVRSFSDSIYNSSIFPFSHTITGIQGKSVGFDILDYFIKKAHSEDIKLHAWINPYRISNDTDISFISKDNPAYEWLNTNNVKIIENKGIYYNPASSEVKNLIVNGVAEIVENYKVDGILFDDYFYPDDTIDLENYLEVENTISLFDFRLSQVNELIRMVYSKIKDINSNVLFGVSPDGNIANNYDVHKADVKTWLRDSNYIDYIMPQVYYGFLHDNKPFIETINEWNDLIKNDVELIFGLALYKVGNKDIYAGTGLDEWVENKDIIKKQIQVSRTLSNYYGFSVFRYEYLLK